MLYAIFVSGSTSVSFAWRIIYYVSLGRPVGVLVGESEPSFLYPVSKLKSLILLTHRSRRPLVSFSYPASRSFTLAVMRSLSSLNSSYLMNWANGFRLLTLKRIIQKLQKRRILLSRIINWSLTNLFLPDFLKASTPLILLFDLGLATRFFIIFSYTMTIKQPSPDL